MRETEDCEGIVYDADNPAALAEPVIIGQGKYRTRFDDEDDPGGFVEVVGKGPDGRWYGMGILGPDCWSDYGVSFRWPNEGGNIVSPVQQTQREGAG